MSVVEERVYMLRGLRFLLIILIIISYFPLGIITIQSQTTTDLITHDNILIEGDVDFQAQATTEGWPGNGTEEDPIIIEDLEIDITVGHGIEMRNTTLHFIIRNSNISWGRYSRYGIYLINVMHCTITDCILEENNHGIRVDYCSGIEISGNAIESNIRYGIYLNNSNSVIVANNNISNNDYGIFTEHSNRNLFENNNISSNTRYGFYTILSHDNAFQNNTFIANLRGGNLLLSNRTLISGNTAQDNGGINIMNSRENTLIANNMVNDGIGLAGDRVEHWITHEIDTSNTVDGKPIYYLRNEKGGTVPPNAGQIILANCTNMSITDQEITSGNTAIRIGFSFKIDIIGNTVSSTRYGITISQSSEILMKGNNLSNNRYYSVYIYDSDSNNISENTFHNNGVGAMFLYNASFNDINNNDFAYNGEGINIYESTHNTVTNNSMTDDCIIIVANQVEQSNTHQIDSSNTVNGKPVYYRVNQTGGDVPMGAGQVILANCTNVTVKNQEIDSI